ncbi:MAG: hypothetical protein QOG53_1849 [Frankiales bacterium]|jgi:hypothetical protein|nr:hypothetical protein [Frankiales bacterium]
MRKSSIATALGILGLATVAVLSPTAHAGTNAFTVTPDHGLPGSSFTAAGNQCFYDPAHVDVTLHEDATTTSPAIASESATPNSDGVWSVEVTVPESATAGDKAVTATCVDDSQNTARANTARANSAPNAAVPNDFNFPPETFTVDAAASASPTPSPTPSPTSDEAPPAPAVDANANFTG